MRESKSNITFYTTITIPEAHIISTRWPAKFMFSYLCWICPDPLIMLVPNSTYVITCFMPDLKRKFQFDPNRLKIDSNRLKSTQIDSFRLIDSTIFHWNLSKSKLYQTWHITPGRILIDLQCSNKRELICLIERLGRILHMRILVHMRPYFIF